MILVAGSLLVMTVAVAVVVAATVSGSLTIFGPLLVAFVLPLVRTIELHYAVFISLVDILQYRI